MGGLGIDSAGAGVGVVVLMRVMVLDSKVKSIKTSRLVVTDRAVDTALEILATVDIQENSRRDHPKFAGAKKCD
jgi:hypothetical protein